MTVKGPKPKPQGQAVNRHAPTHDWVEVPNVPFRGAPKLPARRMNGRMWDPRTRAKWKAWSSMPHCVNWSASMWEFAFDCIELSALICGGETKHMTELRNRERVLGTTPDFLRDLRIRYVKSEKPTASSAAPAAKVTNLADYRNL